MFVYAIKISALPLEIDAKSILNQHFPDAQVEAEKTVNTGDQITIYHPIHSDELFFNNLLRKMGESFTTLARNGWRFLVLRQRHDGRYKPVASYDESVKIGRYAWRGERHRVEAASESLASFLYKKATVEDMEVLRPLLPKTINRLLTNEEKNSPLGTKLLQQACPTLTSTDSRRIFYQMQLVHEKRSGKWKNRLGCAWVSLYFIMSVFLTIAIFSGLHTALNWHSVLAAPTAILLALIPIVGSIAAALSAKNVWEWHTTSVILIFFWYYLPIIYIATLIMFSAFKGNGRKAWNKMLNK